jgi:flagellar basal body rod protein FlgC
MTKLKEERADARKYAAKGYIHPDHALQMYKNNQQYQDWYGSPYKEEDGVVDKTAKHYVAVRMMGGHSFKLTHASGPNRGKSWVLKIGHPKLEEETISEAEGNFPPARLIGAGMKAAKKKHGVDPNMPYKELKTKHPEVAKTGWRIAHVFWRKEKNAAKKPKKKGVAEETVQENDMMKRFFWGPVKKTPKRKKKTEPTTVSGGKPPAENPPLGKQRQNHIEFHENKALTFQQRLVRARQFRRIEPKVHRGQIRYQDRAPTQQRLERRAERMARNMIKMRISHTPYDQMSIPEKIMIDRILEKKQKAIKKLAQRLIPKVRKLSTDRLTRAPQYNSYDYNDKVSIIESKIQNLDETAYKNSLQTITDILVGIPTPATESLRKKAEVAGVTFEEVVSVYAEAIEKYDPENSKINSEQYAFNAVNIFVKEQVNMIAEGMFSSMFIPHHSAISESIQETSFVGPQGILDIGNRVADFVGIAGGPKKAVSLAAEITKSGAKKSVGDLKRKLEKIRGRNPDVK